MNKAIELFGRHIYHLTPNKPLRVRKELSFVYNASGLMCKYFPSKKLLPSRQFMQWAAAESAIRPMKDGNGSAITACPKPCVPIIRALSVWLNPVFCQSPILL